MEVLHGKDTYSYEVPNEKQDEYLKITRDQIKPFWESHGCEAYTVWLSLEGSTRFIKEMVFKDESSDAEHYEVSGSGTDKETLFPICERHNT